MTREEAYSLVDLERFYQDGKWGGEEHDSKHNVADWIIFMEIYLDRAKAAVHSTGKREAMEQILKVTALGVACMESQLEDGEMIGHYSNPEVNF